MTRRLAPGLAWPLSVAELHDALGDLADSVRIVRPGWKKQAGTTPLSVHWWPLRTESIGAAPRTSGPASVWLQPVTRQDQPLIADLLRHRALPDLVAWLQRALTAPPTWQDTRHERRWVITATGVQAFDDDGLHILDRERGR